VLVAVKESKRCDVGEGVRTRRQYEPPARPSLPERVTRFGTAGPELAEVAA
jgi:hypothetical protein